MNANEKVETPKYLKQRLVKMLVVLAVLIFIATLPFWVHPTTEDGERMLMILTVAAVVFTLLQLGMLQEHYFEERSYILRRGAKYAKECQAHHEKLKKKGLTIFP